MNIISLVNHSSEVLRIILKASTPADRVLNQYIRSKKYIGSRDRRFITECVFHYLRNSILINHLSDINKFHFNQRNELFNHCLISTITADAGLYDFTFKPREILKAETDNTMLNIIINELKRQLEFNIDDLTSWYDLIYSQYIEISQNADKSLEGKEDFTDNLDIICTAYSINPWIVNSWVDAGMNQYDAFSIAKSLLFSADIGLRVTRTENRPGIIDHLNDIGIKSAASELSPVGIIVQGRYQLTEIDLYKQGLIEIQDIGSQLISYAVSPSEGAHVLDACAGAGGKTLHLASLQNDTGYIVASDIEFKRLKEIPKRAQRAGLSSITSINVPADPDKWNKEHKAIMKESYFDYVLVDAPCSGMGTARRSPMVKRNLTEKLLKKLHDNQLRILSYYSKFVKPDGILVYATCSLMPQENEDVIEKFLENQSDFVGDPLKPVFENHNIKIPKLDNNGFFVTLNPFENGTDGFFMARMKKLD